MRPRRESWVLTIVASLLVVSALVFFLRDDRDQLIPAIGQELDTKRPRSVRPEMWKAMQAFYEDRGRIPAWVTGRDSGDAADVVRVLRLAAEHGLSPDDYREPHLARAAEAVDRSPDDDEHRRRAALAKLDVELTTALLTLGRDVAAGRTSPRQVDGRWKARRSPPDLAGALARVVGRDLENWLDSLAPAHPEYAALRKALADLRTADAADASTRARIERLKVNLDRWRWMPDDLGAHHVLVNIPAYSLVVREHGQTRLAMRVIVGKADPSHTTPVFSSEMTSVVFSPYWNIPETIAELEIAPAISKDPTYLDRQNIEVLRAAGRDATRVDPLSVDWSNPEALQELAFRQRPGAGNALGHVKFLLPNRFAIYLHDTPADRLFERKQRALSHGCVRLEQPEALAAHVLRSHPEWNAERIREAMHAGTPKSVELEEPIPVHLVYFTAWPDGDAVQFFPDVYRHDARHLAAVKPAS